jgi:hypothetical protein
MHEAVASPEFRGSHFPNVGNRQAAVGAFRAFRALLPNPYGVFASLIMMMMLIMSKCENI